MPRTNFSAVPGPSGCTFCTPSRFEDPFWRQTQPVSRETPGSASLRAHFSRRAPERPPAATKCRLQEPIQLRGASGRAASRRGARLPGRGDSCAARPVRCGLPRAPKEGAADTIRPDYAATAGAAAERRRATGAHGQRDEAGYPRRNGQSRRLKEMPSAGGQTLGGQDRSTALSLWPLGR